ncbi:lipoprotein, putative [Listeria marthii FSL S4-120]|uniref:Lipoprotein, putative n=1 Tax=Listeria marthii FSL S4-120 TaxID=702457 RepID=A0ABP2JYJ5_9LIST|nr:lipoprotein, putative [Listeria marthii FSL S4-120]
MRVVIGAHFFYQLSLFYCNNALVSCYTLLILIGEDKKT